MKILVFIIIGFSVLLLLMYIIFSIIKEKEEIIKTSKLLLKGLAIGIPLIFIWLYFLSMYINK